MGAPHGVAQVASKGTGAVDIHGADIAVYRLSTYICSSITLTVVAFIIKSI
jgi:hypothetical protein